MITPEEVEKIAHLARIYLSKEEKATYATQLQRIFQYMNKLNEVDTTNVEPMFLTKNITCRKRKDQTLLKINKENILKLAPKREKNLIKVRRVIE